MLLPVVSSFMTTATEQSTLQTPRIQNGSRKATLADDNSLDNGDNDNNHLTTWQDEDEWLQELDLDLSIERSVLIKCWGQLLALVAVLDFFAATVDTTFRLFLRTHWAWFDTDALEDWLRDHSFAIGMTFSLLWFLDSFVTAAEWRQRRLAEAQEAQVLRAGPHWQSHYQLLIRQAWTEFCLAILLQSLLLPVGFYHYAWRILTFWVEHDNNEQVETGVMLTQKHAHVSVLMTIVHYLMDESSLRMRRMVVNEGKQQVFGLVRRSLRHPVRAARRFRKITRWIRWLKIVGPLVGTANKLLGNFLDLLKGLRQRALAHQASRLRKRLWKEMTEEELREYAATLIQKIFRASLQRRRLAALRLFQGDEERLAAIKLQSCLRRFLQRVRLDLQKKRVELNKLQEKAKHEGSTDALTEEELKRMYVLRAELANRAHTLVNQKLLLRPNTTFAVLWKSAFVIAVVLELGVIIAKIYHPKITKEDVLPSPWRDLQECQPPKERGFFQKLVHSIRRNKSQADAAPVPWFCEQDNLAYQESAVEVLSALFDFIVLVVFVIYFADVFIRFFTGRFNKVTGVLEPMPAFMRWVAPGILLQLLLNPRMDDVAENLAHVASKIRDLGTVRVFRWTIAFFFPIVLRIGLFLSKLWRAFVAVENQGASPVDFL